MQESKLAWKLTNLGCSWASINLPEKFKLYYSLGTTTFSQYGKIHIFETAKDLWNFLVYYEHIDIYEKRVTELVTIFKGLATNPIHASRIANIGLVEQYWELKKKKKSTWDLSMNPPKGTLLTTDFTPYMQYNINEFKFLIEGLSHPLNV